MTKQTYRLDVDKIKTIKDVKNVLDLMNLVGTYNPEDPEDKYYHLREYFTILQEPQGLTFSIPRRSIEEIQQELDEKIDNLIEKTKRNFYASKLTAERNYEYKFDRIIDNFEFARKNGHFLQKLTLTISGKLSANNYVTSNFVIKSTPMGAGYWDVKPNIQIWLKQKPNWLVRKCAKIFFDFGWNCL